MTALAGWELVYGKCNRCGTRTETLFADGPIRFWAGQATCEHGPHERPPLHDPRVRRAVKKADLRGEPVGLRVNPILYPESVH